MKRIAFMGRRTLRRILSALMGAAAFLFGSCSVERSSGLVEYGPGPVPEYGAPMPYEYISGTVTGNEKPIPGIYVSARDIEEAGSVYDYTHTDEDGVYHLYPYGNGSYTVRFVDVDGPLNGEFKSKSAEWNSGDGPLNVALEPKKPTKQQTE